MNAQAGALQVLQGALVNLNWPTLETMKEQGQIVTLEGAKYTDTAPSGRNLNRAVSVSHLRHSSAPKTPTNDNR